MQIMLAVAQHLRETIDGAKPRLLSIAESRASEKPYPGKWSIKEILGHLVDSASNNHQRIVRMQEVADIGAFSYAQMHWVSSQHYRSEQWNDLVNMWYFYNKHLAHIIEHIDPKSLTNVCDMDYLKPATLQFVAEDYIRHLQHHLDQIFSDADPRERAKWMVVQ
ncbi:MAG: DinB family protein [Ignavibacteria bacterium]|nr:DinB family protein [Ignavibacteria bacterium]